MSELVTGDAVVLGLRPARLPSRALAVLIDLVVAWLVYLAVSMAVLAAIGSLDEAASAAVAVALFLLVLVGIPIAVETLSQGRSLGKLVCGLRVVRDDGGPIRFRHALVRGAVGVIEILASLGTIACIASLISARGRRVGDVLAGTLVVRERIPAARPVMQPAPPPWLAGRFAGVDLSGVPDGLWLEVRQYLTRMSQLDRAVAATMAERLAAEVAARTGTELPEGTPPAAFLAAVAGERRERDARRVFGPAPGGGARPEGAWAAASGFGAGFDAGSGAGLGTGGGFGAMEGAALGWVPGGAGVSDAGVSAGDGTSGGREGSAAGEAEGSAEGSTGGAVEAAGEARPGGAPAADGLRKGRPAGSRAATGFVPPS